MRCLVEEPPDTQAMHRISHPQVQPVDEDLDGSAVVDQVQFGLELPPTMFGREPPEQEPAPANTDGKPNLLTEPHHDDRDHQPRNHIVCHKEPWVNCLSKIVASISVFVKDIERDICRN